MTIKIKLVNKIPNCRIHHIDIFGKVWCSRSNKIFQSDFPLVNFRYLGEIPDNKLKSFLFWPNPIERLVRVGIWQFLPLTDKKFVVIVSRSILTTKYVDGSIKILQVFKIPRGSQPLSICKGSDNQLYWGEYFMNHGRNPVHIYGSGDGGDTWNIVYTFEAGEIKHVHRIIYDRFLNGYWVLTGDRDEECRILFTGDNFKSLIPILRGGQETRAASIIPVKAGLIIPMDSPTEDAYVQWFDFQTKKLIKLKKIESSSLHSTEVGGKYFFSTTVEPKEPDSYNVRSKKIRQYLYNFNITQTGYKNKIFLYGSANGKNWSRLWSEEKDFYPIPLFQFGTLSFPLNEYDDLRYLYVNCQAVLKKHGFVLVFNLIE